MRKIVDNIVDNVTKPDKGSTIAEVRPIMNFADRGVAFF